jgi:DNA-binding NarL/FixJ family response regulator
MKPATAAERVRPTVLIADDHKLVADGLASLVEGTYEVLGTVENGGELLKAALQQQPNLVLIDYSMPDMAGPEVVETLLAELPGIKVIFVTMHSKAEFVREAFSAGAMGYVLKRSAASELADAMREVMSGNAYISPQIAGDVLTTFLNPRSTPLTERQRQVLRLISEGRSGKEIAQSLNISVKTAQFHKTTIMEKLGIHTTAELTKYAIDHGIIR